MKLTNILFTFLLLVFSALAARVTNPSKVPRNAVLLSKVSSLTLHAGRETAGRRSSPVPQLKCVGPRDVCKLYTVDTIRCKNEGSDYESENVQWACRAQLPDEFKLGSTEVGCEGYESSEDPYILKGSCGVEYRLLLTDKGEEKYRARKEYTPPKKQDTSHNARGQGYNNYTSESAIPGAMFMTIFLVVLAIIAYGLISSCLNSTTTEGRNPTPRTGGSGGGGNDDDNDPPPPYDYSLPPKKKSTPRSSTRSQPGNRNQTQDGWRPGFWTGAATGAAGGYMAGRRNQNTQTAGTTTVPREQPQPQMQQRSGWNWPNLNIRRAGSSSPRHSPPPPASPPSSSSSGPSYSSSRYESTGFGGTNRR